jgi:hypothetical protein
VEEADCGVGRVEFTAVGVMEALEPRVVEGVKDALLVLVGVNVAVGVVLELVDVVAVRVTVEVGEGVAVTVGVAEAVMLGVLVPDGEGVRELVAELGSAGTHERDAERVGLCVAVGIAEPLALAVRVQRQEQAAV